MLQLSTSKDQYKDLCRSELSIPIFSRDWWLDAACGDENWDVALAESGGKVVGALPYYFRKRLGSVMITMPKLTQTLGPWIKYSSTKKSQKKLSHEHEVISALIDSLPPYGHFNQRLHHSYTNWLPFYWKGFEQTTRYTYVLPDLTDLEKVYQAVDQNVRRYIPKAQSAMDVIISDDIDEFYAINSFVFSKQGMVVPYSLDYVRRLDSACKERGRRRIFVARDGNNEIHAALYIIWDEESAYLLMSGIDPKFKSDGATKMLYWEAIKFASEVTKRFDFEGSMLKAVEATNRSFGGVQVPYFDVSKTNAFHLRLLGAVQRLQRTKAPH